MNYGNKSNNRRVYQPKTSITNQVITDEEKLAAETALRSLKQKMANKEKKPIRQTNTANQGRSFDYRAWSAHHVQLPKSASVPHSVQ